MDPKTKRIEFIDVARGIAMVLVVLGHCNMYVDTPLNKFILSFHMPLFFFLSGMFAKKISDKKMLMGGGKIENKDFTFATSNTISHRIY